MRELPNVGDRVRVPFGLGTAEGIVAMVQDPGIDLQIMVNVKVDILEEPFRVMYTRDEIEVIEPMKPFEFIDDPVETA